MVIFVTPCVGVWIETINSADYEDEFKSHPAWVCGLKLASPSNLQAPSIVTPCVGVWIETLSP